MTTMTPTSTATAVPASARKAGIARTAVLTTLAAATANISVFGLARGLGVGFAPAGPTRTATVAGGAVVATTLVAMAIGWTLAALATRRHRHKMRTMAIIGGAFAAVSTIAPLTLNVGISAKLTLACLHLLGGAFYVVGLAHLIRAGARATR
jgi:hypothetical protein